MRRMAMNSMLGKATLAVAGALLLAGSALAQNTIKIGVITDKIGPAKPYAEPVLQGVEFGAKEINAKGGILGKKIELIVEDDQGKPDVSATMARKQSKIPPLAVT